MKRIPSEIIKKILTFYIGFTEDKYERLYKIPGLCGLFSYNGYDTFCRDPENRADNYRDHLCLFHENATGHWWPTGPVDYGDHPPFDDIYLNCVVPRIEYLILLLKEQIAFELSDNNQNPTQ